MSREIKFRAWCHESKEMYFPRTFKMRNGAIIGIDTPFVDSTYGSKNMCESLDGYVSLMQFTGLLDKNGKEIYEGDIARHWYKNSVVERIEQTGIVEWILSGLHLHYPVEKPKYVSSIVNQEYGEQKFYYEVIGNIYENPELLK